MGTADDQIRVSETVKRKLERYQREGESYNDTLNRILSEQPVSSFADGFGRWSDEKAERVRKQRQKAKEERKRRMRDRQEDT